VTDAFAPPKYFASLISAANDGAKSAQTTLLDVWQPFRSKMDRLFDRFGSGFGFLSLRRMFDIEPAWHSSFSFSTAAIDMREDEKVCKISAELPGIAAKDKTSGLR
jgi:HSP20 family molecular chaperone IbpA